MNIREYAAVGKSNRFVIIRQDYRYLRTAFVESNQRGHRTTRLSKAIKASPTKAISGFIAIVIADRVG